MTIVTEPTPARPAMPESAMPATTSSSHTESTADPITALNAGAGEVDLAALVGRHQAEIWRYVRYLGARPAEADDLTQDVFLEVARKPFTEYSPQQSASYLRTVAQNLLLMLRRRQQREGHQIDLDVAESVWSETVWAKQTTGSFWNEYATALVACTEKLEGRSRQVIDLCYREQTSREQIAEAFGMKPDGVKTLLRRVRQKLRECVERQLAASS